MPEKKTELCVMCLNGHREYVCWRGTLPKHFSDCPTCGSLRPYVSELPVVLRLGGGDDSPAERSE